LHLLCFACMTPVAASQPISNHLVLPELLAAAFLQLSCTVPQSATAHTQPFMQASGSVTTSQRTEPAPCMHPALSPALGSAQTPTYLEDSQSSSTQEAFQLALESQLHAAAHPR
jgi:hypothetical protein